MLSPNPRDFYRRTVLFFGFLSRLNSSLSSGSIFEREDYHRWFHIGQPSAHFATRFYALALGELRTFTRFAQTHFLPLNGARITGQKASLAHGLAQAFVVLDQSPGDAMADSASLA